MSKVQVDTIDTRSGTSTMQIGSTNTSTINIGVSGDTVNIPSGVTIANAGTATGFGGDNTPSFSAYGTSDQTVSNATETKVQFGTEDHDTDNAFSSNRFTVPSGEGGKYFITSSVMLNATQNADLREGYLRLYKNGSAMTDPWYMSLFGYQSGGSSASGQMATPTISATLTLSAGDYIEVFGYVERQGGGDGRFDERRNISGFKVII